MPLWFVLVKKATGINVSTKLMCICTLCDHSYFLFSSQIAEQKLYEHWKQNAPELREV